MKKLIKESTSLKYKADKIVGNEHIYVSIRLNDDCKNGHQDFAITGDIYRANRPKTDSNHISGGCIHDEILKHFPEFKIFVDLHLCDCNGVPMHATANGYYDLRNGFNREPIGHPDFATKYCEYYRISTGQFNVLNGARSEVEFAMYLRDLGVLEQWKLQAIEAIKLLESLTGTKFVNDSKKSNLYFPSDEKIAEHKKMVSEGFYTPDAQRERREKNILIKLNEMDKEAERKIEAIMLGVSLKKMLYSLGGDRYVYGVIHYNHNNTIKFNWSDTVKPLADSEIEQIKTSLKDLKGFENVNFIN